MRRIPIRCWPDAERPATYHGAQEIEDAVVQIWKADPGTVCVVWSRPGLTGLSLPRVATQFPDADALIHVLNVFEPELSTAQPDNLTDWNDFGATWADLARVLGQPAPYWPLMLRIPTLISSWKPGTPPATYPTIPEVNTTPLLRLAATLPQNSPAHKVLLHLARVAQQSSTISALQELRTLDHDRHNGDVTVVAAHPLPIPKVDRETVSEQDRRSGWLEIFVRTDQLAAECVREANKWDGARDFPFSNPEQIDPTTEYGAEWSARLEPVERTAAFELIDRKGDCETLTDPETDAVVVRKLTGSCWPRSHNRCPTLVRWPRLFLTAPFGYVPRMAGSTLRPRTATGD